MHNNNWQTAFTLSFCLNGSGALQAWRGKDLLYWVFFTVELHSYRPKVSRQRKETL